MTAICCAPQVVLGTPAQTSFAMMREPHSSAPKALLLLKELFSLDRTVTVQFNVSATVHQAPKAATQPVPTFRPGQPYSLPKIPLEYKCAGSEVHDLIKANAVDASSRVIFAVAAV